ncbi:MAG: long-chain fatty acid--CoA ligase [Myxococcaceae bacterium]|nr:long-chain fatty acid--CoA ligase [Myxococcaceae bacterium]
MRVKPFIERLASFADAPALHTAERTHTYGELHRAVLDRAAWLEAHGVSRPHSIVLLEADYSLDGIALLLALFNQDQIVGLSSGGPDAEARLAALDPHHVIDARALTVAHREASHAHPLTERLPGGRAGLVLFSSGTTGRPKAMLHDLDTIVDAFLGRRPRRLNVLLLLMFDHIGGLNSLLSTLAMGGAAALPRERSPDAVCGMVARHGVVVLPASPTFLNLMLLSGACERHDLSSLRLITYGTEPMPESLLTRLKARFPKVKLLQTFGTSETGIASTVSLSSGSLFMKIDDPSMEHKIVDGELWLRSQRQILGYLNEESTRFTADGWFRTGDMVETTGDGFFRIRGRQTDIINVGGEKVFPGEVESCVGELPFVADCRAYGQANALTGQAVWVDVVLKPGSEPAGADAKARVKEIRAFTRERLDAFKVPVRINVVDAIAYSARFKKLPHQEQRP